MNENTDYLDRLRNIVDTTDGKRLGENEYLKVYDEFMMLGMDQRKNLHPDTIILFYALRNLFFGTV